MSRIPKKIKHPDWVEDFTWDSTHQFFYKKFNSPDWKGEKKLASVLKKIYDNVYSNVVFVVNNTAIPYVFDFVVPDENLVIEYNGEEHYHYSPELHESPAMYLKRVSSDFNKILFCWGAGYKYLPISYDQNITVDSVKYYIDSYAGDVDYVINHYKTRYEKFDGE